MVECVWKLMAHGDAREGKWRGNWRMECVTSTLHTTSEHGVSSITTADAHTSAASSRLNWRPRRLKWTRPFRRNAKSCFCACAIIFQTHFSTTGPDPENRVCDQDIGSPGRPLSSGLQVSGKPGHCRTRTRPLWWSSPGVYPSKCPSFASAEINNTPHWQFGPLEDNQWEGCHLDPKKSRRELFQQIFALGNFGGGWSVMPPLHWLLLCIRVIVI